MNGRMLLAASVILVAAACAGSDRQGAVGGAPLLTPTEAAGRSGVVAVQGFFWARPADGIFRLCAGGGSSPPTCTGDTVDLTGVDVTEIAGIAFSQNVFSAREVRARGTLRDGTLAVDEIELNAGDSSTGLTFRILVPVEVSSGPAAFDALVTNSSSQPLTLRFISGQSSDLTLSDVETGAIVYRWGAAREFDQASRELILEPGETRALPQMADPEFGLEAGAYDLLGVLAATPAPGSVRGRVVVR
jgi:hypothetical protein